MCISERFLPEVLRTTAGVDKAGLWLKQGSVLVVQTLWWKRGKKRKGKNEWSMEGRPEERWEIITSGGLGVIKEARWKSVREGADRECCKRPFGGQKRELSSNSQIKEGSCQVNDPFKLRLQFRWKAVLYFSYPINMEFGMLTLFMEGGLGSFGTLMIFLFEDYPIHVTYKTCRYKNNPKEQV